MAKASFPFVKCLLILLKEFSVRKAYFSRAVVPRADLPLLRLDPESPSGRFAFAPLMEGFPPVPCWRLCSSGEGGPSICVLTAVFIRNDGEFLEVVICVFLNLSIWRDI